MERRAENSLRQDAIDAANNNIFAEHEFRDLVQQVEEWDRAGTEQATHTTKTGVAFTYRYREAQPPRS